MVSRFVGDVRLGFGRRVPIEQTEAALRFIVTYVKETFGCPIAFYTNTRYDSEPYLEGYREWWTPKFIEFCQAL